MILVIAVVSAMMLDENNQIQNCYCTVLYCTVLYCTVLYCTVLYCSVLYCTVQETEFLYIYPEINAWFAI